MNFMSTRIVYQLERIFEEMKEARTAKQAQEKLRVLSLREDFELALSTFLARCNDKDQILLSLVLLQKQPKITNIQTIWTLKPLYYHSHPKISQLTSTIITKPQNIPHAFQFLKSNLHNINLSEFIKYIDLLYDLLQRVDNNLSGENVQQLGRCFEECFSVINSHEELYLMCLVCLFMFYRRMVNKNNNQQVHQHWNNVILPKLQSHNETNSNECYHHLCQNMIQTQILQEMLSALANSTPLKYTTNQFKILLTELFKCWQSSNLKRYKYLIVILEGLFQLELMVIGQGVMVQFLESVRGWNQMSNLNKRISYEVYGDYQIDHSDIPSQRLTNITDHCINTLFNQYQTWLSTIYLLSLTQGQALHQITILLNMYTSHSPIATQIIRSTIQQIGKYLQQVIESNSINEGQVDRIMNYVEFLAKYSGSVDLEGLVEICGWLSQVAMVMIQVCGLCYGLMEEVWERFTFLECNGLLCFLEQHLKMLNANVWGMTLNNYQCALHLSLYLEHTYSFISTLNNTHHPTNIQILKAYSTIIQLLKQTKEEKINIEIVKSVIKLLAYLIKSGNVGLQGEEDEFSVWFVGEKMVKFGVLSYEGAIVMGVCRMKKGILQGEVDRELNGLELDEHDYEYNIKLYIELIKNTAHLSSINYINNHHHIQSHKQYPTSPQLLLEVLLSKILQFLKQIQPQKEVKSNLKQSIIWQQLKTTITFYNNNTNPSKILHLMSDISQIIAQ